MPKGDKKNIILERRKPKNPQSENLAAVDGRDLFNTPNYGTELLLPYIPKNVKWIWEPAVGKGKIRWILEKSGFSVIGSDLNYDDASTDLVFNFVTDEKNFDYPPVECIITNPPFSLKRKFYETCRKYNIPFALLIPADYAGWIIKAIMDGAEKIIPTRRIDYITPTGLSGATGHTSYFHSMWLTWGFNLGKTETFVELTKQMKENI